MMVISSLFGINAEVTKVIEQGGSVRELLTLTTLI